MVRITIRISDSLLSKIDSLRGERSRSDFIREAIKRYIEEIENGSVRHLSDNVRQDVRRASDNVGHSSDTLSKIMEELELLKSKLEKLEKWNMTQSPEFRSDGSEESELKSSDEPRPDVLDPPSDVNRSSHSKNEDVGAEEILGEVLDNPWVEILTKKGEKSERKKVAV